MKSIIQSRAYLSIALVLSACAGSSISMPHGGGLTAVTTSSLPQMEAAPVVNGSPSQIIVFPFAVSMADVTVNQGFGARVYSDATDASQTAEQAQLARQTSQNICYQVVTALASKGWNAECRPRGTPVTGNNTLVIDGAFTDISQGNHLQRTVIGLGMGQSVVDTQVAMFQASNGNSTQLTTFTTHADSGNMPGAGIIAPAAAAAGGAAAAALLTANMASGGVKSVTTTAR